jgi:hypothetical protein
MDCYLTPDQVAALPRKDLQSWCKRITPSGVKANAKVLRTTVHNKKTARRHSNDWFAMLCRVR